jgi:hypothetical protein
MGKKYHTQEVSETRPAPIRRDYDVFECLVIYGQVIELRSLSIAGTLWLER